MTIFLKKLIVKNVFWIWKQQKHNVYNKLQQIYLNESILKTFDSQKSIRIETNVLNLIIKICFNQKHENKWHSMIYFFKKFSLTKQNYDIHDKKLLAIITILKSWKIYVKKSLKLKILIDYKNFMHFIITKQLNKRQMRWSKLFE